MLKSGDSFSHEKIFVLRYKLKQAGHLKQLPSVLQTGYRFVFLRKSGHNIQSEGEIHLSTSSHNCLKLDLYESTRALLCLHCKISLTEAIELILNDTSRLRYY